MKIVTIVTLFVSLRVALGLEIKTVNLEPAPSMTRADLQYVITVSSPRAVLVLSPGCNGNGDDFLQSKQWINFAIENSLGLVGLSFASPLESLQDGTGYYYAGKGSGQKLVDGIHAIYGKDLPLLLYGISGGAHFTSRFVEWRPEQVIAWCAYSAGWWDKPKANQFNPPGIVACGDRDDRYGASLIYFKQGRAAGKPWLWVSLSNIGHVESFPLENFVRKYFLANLNGPLTPEFVDIDSKKIVSLAASRQSLAFTGWLPSESLFNLWNSLHEP